MDENKSIAVFRSSVPYRQYECWATREKKKQIIKQIECEFILKKKMKKKRQQRITPEWHVCPRPVNRFCALSERIDGFIGVEIIIHSPEKKKKKCV